MAAETTSKKQSGKIAPWTFFPPLIFIVALCAWVISDPTAAGAAMGVAFSFVTNEMAWYFQIFFFIVILLLVFLCVSPIGKKRFGEEDPSTRCCHGRA